MILRLVALWVSAALALWVHALLGIPGDYLGRGFPLYPGLRVTRGDLALTALGATVPIPLAAALARHFHLRWLALPPLFLLWLWAAHMMISPFVSDFGTTWRMTEPLRDLFVHPLHTPLALALLAVVAAWSLARPKAG